MSNSIFEKTMVDMTYPEIEQAAKDEAGVLFPISVVEEHGPHLCTGTDIYLTQNVCLKIKEKLDNTLIAPPYFWGINSITDDFTGSFSISPQLMEAVILEILDNFRKWGFHKIFLLSFHGDYRHIQQIASIAQKASSSMAVYYVNTCETCAQFGLPQDASYILPVKVKLPEARPKYIDIHAGTEETSWMLLNYPDLVKTETASQLSPTDIGLPDLKRWLQGGKTAREITPLGYLGNPADFDIEKIRLYEDRIIEAFAQAISKKLFDYTQLLSTSFFRDSNIL